MPYFGIWFEDDAPPRIVAASSDAELSLLTAQRSLADPSEIFAEATHRFEH
jgi:hypothetical protein